LCHPSVIFEKTQSLVTEIRNRMPCAGALHEFIRNRVWAVSIYELCQR